MHDCSGSLVGNGGETLAWNPGHYVFSVMMVWNCLWT